LNGSVKLQCQQHFTGLELRFSPKKKSGLRVPRKIFKPKREQPEEKRIHNGELRHLQATSSPNI
jgi:hypothetical protein